MSHKVFSRHTYIYKCSARDCGGEWKINEAEDLDRLSCPHCGKNDTIDYVTVYRLVKEQMSIRSKLIEHVAGRILEALLREYQLASKVTVELTKLNPPVNGTLGSATVVVSGEH